MGRYKQTAAAAMAGAAVLFLFGVFAIGQDAGRIDWKSDLEQARAEAMENGRPMMIVFR